MLATHASPLFCTMVLVSVVHNFPDNVIGKKYILAKTSGGSYQLVPDGSNLPGIPVSSVTSKPAQGFTTPISNNQIMNEVIPGEKPLEGNVRAKNEESVVTLALQGRDGLDGKPGRQGKAGPPGPPGRQGPPGQKGEAGTCNTPQFQYDTNLLQTLSSRISQLEKTCSKGYDSEEPSVCTIS